MIRTVCTACDAEIEVPTAGENTCPACGLSTTCFAPPPDAEADAAALLALKLFRLGVRTGFPRGFAAGLALALAAYWLCILAARWPR